MHGCDELPSNTKPRFGITAELKVYLMLNTWTCICLVLNNNTILHQTPSQTRLQGLVTLKKIFNECLNENWPQALRYFKY